MRDVRLIAVLLVGVLTSLPCDGTELPVRTFFRNYRHEMPALSPDGSCLGVLATAKGRVGVASIDVQTGDLKWAFWDPASDVRWFSWATGTRLILGQVMDGFVKQGLVAVERDGSQPTILSSVLGFSVQLVSYLPRSQSTILVSSLQHGERPSDAYLLYPSVERMDLYTGHMQLDTKNPGHTLWWIPDHQDTVRVAIERNETRYRVLYRNSAAAPWVPLEEFNWNDDRAFWPDRFDYDDRTLLVSATQGADTTGVYTYDPGSKELKNLLFRHPAVDVSGFLFSDKKRAVVGVWYDTDRPEVQWLDADYRAMQASVDSVLTNTINVLVSRSLDEARAVFLATSDRTPGAYYLFDRTAMTLKKICELAEWIHPEEMAEMKPIEYQSRDGLKIHGYLTMPRESGGQPVAMVVMPHGGPRWRDTWGFDPAVQFLANRGYAVLQVNFRGSSGYGRTFLKAGYKQWGLKQQDDITDGVKWAIEHGYADPKRIAIFGVSYGGFAALTGLEKTPELYRCGISYAGVCDLVHDLSTVPDLKIFKTVVAETIGDPKRDKQQLKDTSPIAHLDKIQAPVFLASGELDPKVPIANQRTMAKTLEKEGKLYAFMVKADEGHGFHKEKNRIEFWTKVDEFLKVNLK